MTDVLDLSKWIDEAVRTVRKACEKKQKPCVAFSLLFFDPMAQDEQKWNFANYFVGDKYKDKHTEEDKERIELAFMYIQEGVKRIMAGEAAKPPDILH